MRTSLMVDVGQVLVSRKNVTYVGVGYEYWHNKYGNQPGVGTQVNAPQFQVEWHFLREACDTEIQCRCSQLNATSHNHHPSTHERRSKECCVDFNNFLQLPHT